jgi:hypothetical protein
METLRAALRIELAGIVLAFAALLAWKAWRGKLPLGGLMSVADERGRRRWSPARAQLLATASAVALYCLARVTLPSGGGAFPGLGWIGVAVVGASNAVYLAAEFRRSLARPK